MLLQSLWKYPLTLHVCRQGLQYRLQRFIINDMSHCSFSISTNDFRTVSGAIRFTINRSVMIATLKIPLTQCLMTRKCSPVIGQQLGQPATGWQRGQSAAGQLQGQLTAGTLQGQPATAVGYRAAERACNCGNAKSTLGQALPKPIVTQVNSTCNVTRPQWVLTKTPAYHHFGICYHV